MMAKEHKHLQNFTSPIWGASPLFVSLLGLCPALAVTKSIESAFGMGVLFTIVLVCSNVLVSAIRKIVPDEVRTPANIVVIAAFVTLVKMFSEAYLPELYTSLGVFISLLVVNCVILGRAEAFAVKNGVFDSLLDGLGNGLGYTIAILLIATFREALGSGMIRFGVTFPFLVGGGDPFCIYLLKGPGYDLSMKFFSDPAGGFLVLAIILAIVQAVNIHNENKKRIEAKKAKEAAKAAASKQEVAK